MIAIRTGQNILDVAGNISWIDDKSLRLIEQQHINQALVRIPRGWISRGNGQEHLTAIRSPVLTGAGGCGAFFIAQDGLSLRAPGFLMLINCLTRIPNRYRPLSCYVVLLALCMALMQCME